MPWYDIVVLIVALALIPWACWGLWAIHKRYPVVVWLVPGMMMLVMLFVASSARVSRTRMTIVEFKNDRPHISEWHGQRFRCVPVEDDGEDVR